MIGFVASSKVISIDYRKRERRPKSFKDSKFEALLNDDPLRTQRAVLSALRATHQAIFRRLQALQMIQKQGNCVPSCLRQGDNESGDVERRLSDCKELLQVQMKGGSLLHSLLLMKNGFIKAIQSAQNQGNSKIFLNVIGQARCFRGRGSAVNFMRLGQIYLL